MVKSEKEGIFNLENNLLIHHKDFIIWSSMKALIFKGSSIATEVLGNIKVPSSSGRIALKCDEELSTCPFSAETHNT